MGGARREEEEEEGFRCIVQGFLSLDSLKPFDVGNEMEVPTSNGGMQKISASGLRMEVY